MQYFLAHKIRLKPTKDQAQLFKKAVGIARFAYNWALAEWKNQYAAGQKPSELKLRRQLNAIKESEFPWMYEVSKTVVQQAIKNLGNAYVRFFKGLSKYPVFKKKFCRDSARMDDGPHTVKINGKCVRFPKIGWVKMAEHLRFEGKPYSLTLSRKADQWFVSIMVKMESEALPKHESQMQVGADLGISTAVALSNHEEFPGPKPLKFFLKRLKRLQRKFSKKKRGSANRRKAAAKIARLHLKISNIRADWLHRLTTRLARSFSLICIEDLNVSGMLKNHKWARAVADIGLYEFRRQLEYKCELTGSTLFIANRWFPSSKTCSGCGHVLKNLTLQTRSWTCPNCETSHDRDINAAINLLNLGRVSSDVKLVEKQALASSSNAVCETSF